jgi:hypothetical protein
MARAVGVVAALFSLAIAPALRADEPGLARGLEPEAPSPALSPSLRIDSVRPAPRSRSQLITLVAGFVFVSVGSTVAAGHFFDSHAPDRPLALLPVVGPLGVVARDHLSADWTAALVFSSCAQTLGALTITLALGTR